MIIIDSIECGPCKNKTFAATGLVNDEPMGDSKDEWKTKLIFICENCSNVVTEIVTNMDYLLSLETNYSNWNKIHK